MCRETQQKGRERGFRGRGKARSSIGSEKVENSINGQGAGGGNSVGRVKGSLRRGKIKYAITITC